MSYVTSTLLSAAADTNATSVKGSAGRVFRVSGYNAAAAARYLKFYDKATAPTVGTDTPVRVIALAPTAAFSHSFEGGGLPFTLGIGYGMVTGAANNSTAALTAADVVGLNIDYQ